MSRIKLYKYDKTARLCLCITVRKMNVAGFLKYYMFWRFPLRNCRKYCERNPKYTIAFGGQRVYDNDNERDRPSTESLPASNDSF